MESEKVQNVNEMIAEFSDQYLDEEFGNLNVKLLYELSNCPEFQLDNEKPENIACAVIYAIGQLNFLFERSFDPYVSRDVLCGYFSAGRTKINNMARDIRRLLNLKLGNPDFSTDFVLSLNIAESDGDLKRIRLFQEVKSEICRRPADVDSLDNGEIMALINKIRLTGKDCWDELCLLLRSTYFIRAYKDFMPMSLVGDDGKFMVAVFTSIDRCNIITDDVDFRLWPFANVLYVLGNEDFEGVIVNLSGEEFVIGKDMIRRVYPDPDRFDYFGIFFSG